MSSRSALFALTASLKSAMNEFEGSLTISEPIEVPSSFNNWYQNGVIFIILEENELRPK
jgi:hypothetical protein